MILGFDTSDVVWGIGGFLGLVIIIFIVTAYYIIKKRQEEKVFTNKQIFQQETVITPLSLINHKPETADVNPQVSIDITPAENEDYADSVTSETWSVSSIPFLEKPLDTSRSLSFDHINYLEEPTLLRERSGSCSSIISKVSDDYRPPIQTEPNFSLMKKGVQIDFKLLHNRYLNELQVNVFNLTGLYLKYKNYIILLKINLIIGNIRMDETYCVKNKGGAATNSCVYKFHGVGQSEVRKSRLEFRLTAKRHLREKELGELTVYLDDVDVRDEKIVTFQRTFTEIKSRRVSYYTRTEHHYCREIHDHDN